MAADQTTGPATRRSSRPVPGTGSAPPPTATSADGGPALRDSVLVDKILRDRARRYAVPLQHDLTAGNPHVCFRRGEVRYLVPLTRLSEIRGAERITRVPGVSAAIAGLVHLRGRIVTVHDLAWRTTARGASAEGWLLVCAGNLDHLALLADGVDDIRELDEATLRPAPVTLSLPASCAPFIDADAAIVLDLDGLRREPAFFRA